jgi:hypothetical protein
MIERAKSSAVFHDDRRLVSNLDELDAGRMKA